eukprot:scaffold117291_cov42-Phaeocystis_antarctica.AAC.2
MLAPPAARSLTGLARRLAARSGRLARRSLARRSLAEQRDDVLERGPHIVTAELRAQPPREGAVVALLVRTAAHVHDLARGAVSLEGYARLHE